MTGVETRRVVEELAELALVAPERLAWTEEWRRGREWFRTKALAVGLDLEVDRAGNEWFTVRGSGDGAVVIGGHLDTATEAPGGDGSLSLLAGLEVARRVVSGSAGPVRALRIVDWTDGAGARFGRPFGVSAAAGRLRDWYVAQELVDASGVSLREVAEANAIEPRLAQSARRNLAGTTAYIELACDPARSSAPGEPTVTAATRAAGVERCHLRWSQAIDAPLPGTPGRAGEAADRFARDLATTASESTPRVALVPAGSPADVVEQLFEEYDSDPERLEAGLGTALDVSDRIARDEAVAVEWRRLWRAPPVGFDPDLTALLVHLIAGLDPASEITAATPYVTTLQCGASELARSRAPAALLLIGSNPGGWSEDALGLAIRALDRFVERLAVRPDTDPET